MTRRPAPTPAPAPEPSLPPLAPAPWQAAAPPPRPAPWTALVRTFLWSPFGLALLGLAIGAGWLGLAWQSGRATAGTAAPEAAADPLASLYIDADVPGAVAWVDGDSLGPVPVRVHGLVPGGAFVSVRAGAAQADTLVRLAAGGDEHVVVRVAPVVRALALAETASPGGTSPRDAPADEPSEGEPAPAALFSDPETPLPSERLTHARPEPARPAVRAPEAGLATVEVIVPPGSAIFIDGQLRVPRANVLYRTELPPGAHHIRWVHPTLGLGEETVTVAPGVTFRVTFETAAAP